MRTRSATEWKTDLDFQSLVGIYLLSLVSGIGVFLVCFLGQDTQVTYTLVALLLSIRQCLALDGCRASSAIVGSAVHPIGQHWQQDSD
jgi:hypothetical protein